MNPPSGKGRNSTSSRSIRAWMSYLTADAALRAGEPSFAGHEKSARQILGVPGFTKPALASADDTPAHAAVIRYDIQARIDRLAVEFRPLPEGGFTDVYLTGPAEEVL